MKKELSADLVLITDLFPIDWMICPCQLGQVINFFSNFKLKRTVRRFAHFRKNALSFVNFFKEEELSGDLLLTAERHASHNIC